MRFKTYIKVSTQLMHLDKGTPLHKSSSTKDLVESFSNFFIAKIENILNGFSDIKSDTITHNTGDSKVTFDLVQPKK